jgi:hypothetical protein
VSRILAQPITMIPRNDLLAAALYFLLSVVLTWLFVILCPLYVSQEQMILSTAIAGGKWAVQIVFGFILLKEKSMLFLRRIGYVCFVGSCILIPYIVSSLFNITDSPRFFFISLVAAVLIMILTYYQEVKSMKISLGWWVAWLVCLAIAVTLQLTVVFNIV